MGTAIKMGSICLKDCCKKVACKDAQATRQFKGNKITNKIVKPKSVPDVEERVIPPEKREEVLNDSVESKFLKKK